MLIDTKYKSLIIYFIRVKSEELIKINIILIKFLVLKNYYYIYIFIVIYYNYQ